MTKNLFLYHSQHTPPAFTFQKRASPGIEPGPLAPEESILPLNYEALHHILLFSNLEKKGHNRIRTNDHGNCSPMLYH